MVNESKIIIRNITSDEFSKLGELLVVVYSNLDGFPKPEEQPNYYNLLKNVGEFTKNESVELFGVFGNQNELLGGVVFFGDMQFYGSGGTATLEKNAAGFRLLGVSDKARGKGLGKLLTLKCIERAKELKVRQIIIHTTLAMKPAWKMYETIGFKRSEDLDFMQGEMEVFGFRLEF